jgi:hypothetical protein
LHWLLSSGSLKKGPLTRDDRPLNGDTGQWSSGSLKVLREDYSSFEVFNRTGEKVSGSLKDYPD